jgi:hypothetical protein
MTNFERLQERSKRMRHGSLMIERNPHHSNEWSISKYVEAMFSNRNSEITRKCEAARELWSIHVYPGNSPFIKVYEASLEDAAALALIELENV